ncbi:MAG: ABC transporter permease [Bacilli bacterium]|nr:ABC transporter permease [Bacilli bacterium]
MVKKILSKTYIYLVLLLMYLPILVLIAFSFSGVTSIGDTVAEGESWFSTIYWQNLFSDTKIAGEIWTALGNTLIVAVVSAIVATILGTLGAIGAFYSRKKAQKAIEVTTQIPVSNPEIVIALSLVVMFVAIGIEFNFWTLLVGHVILGLPFVYLSVRPKLQQMDPHLYEAALDLGATPRQGLFKVIIPEIMPGILSGFLLSITLSLDDFIVTAFTRGAGLLSGDKTIETLSTLIQSKLKKGPIPPEMRPLTLIIFLAVLAVAIGVTVYKNKQANAVRVRKGRANV